MLGGGVKARSAVAPAIDLHTQSASTINVRGHWLPHLVHTTPHRNRPAQFSNYDSTTGGPATAYMAPKLDHFLKQVQVHAGVDIPVPKVSTL